MSTCNGNVPDRLSVLDLDPTELLRAQWERDAYGIPEYVYQAWRSQRGNAAARGIPFRFGLLQWRLWWVEALAAIGPHAQRGLRRGQYMMCRHGDAGAYEPGNVYAGTARDNQRGVPADTRQRKAERIRATREANVCPLGQHLRVRGDGHPRSHAVLTPAGRFGSIALASEAHGFSRTTGLMRVRAGVWVRVE